MRLTQKEGGKKKTNLRSEWKLISILDSNKNALLDREPRSADAVATNETILLKIDQEGFYELMAGNSEIMREIVKMLAERLRSMNKEITKH